jgi:hypothetical protein
MECFYHEGIAAVAICKNCCKGMCRACASDVGNGVACRDRCEKRALAVNNLVNRNLAAVTQSRSLVADLVWPTALFTMGLASTIAGALAGTASLFIGPPLVFIGAFMAWQNLRIRWSWRAAL